MGNRFEKFNVTCFMRPAVSILLFWLLLSAMARAQNYHAIEGSPYAGSLGVAVNPASILNTPYPWDLTIFSLQEKHSTNAVVFHRISYLSHSDTADYNITNGYFRRFAAFNFNIHLLNLRLALGRKQAIAFGANLRGYEVGKTGAFNYIDSLRNTTGFFKINEGASYNGNIAASSWLELFGTYSRTLVDNERGRLNAGVTLKAMRGIGGAYAQLKGGDVRRAASGDVNYYLLNAGTVSYGYAANFDKWHDSLSTLTNIKNIVRGSRGGFAMDLGVEYLIKSQAITTYADGDIYHEYEWKIGISLLDVGWNAYKYGTQSRIVSNPKTNIADSTLNQKFNHVNKLADFNDSLATIVNYIAQLNGSFKIWNPTRLVINVDRPLADKFSINGNLSLNIAGSGNGRQHYVKDITLLGITPRWETQNLGAYLPVQVSTEGKVWIGGAFKAGPLLFGIHNWANVFSKNNIQNGGFYLALVIRPGSGFKVKEDKKYTCPKN